MRRSEMRPFEEAREFARGLGLTNTSEWYAWTKSDERPADIPSSPNKAYRGKWEGWGDWLGTGRRRLSDEWRPFEEAREDAWRLGLRNKKEWNEWTKSEQRPSDIPIAPNIVYTDEWRGWPDWLGTDKQRTFEEAREFVHGLGLRSEKEWRAWRKTEQRPNDIPTNPEKVYANEWRGWGDWLGTGSPTARRGVDWRPFEEAREFVRGLGLEGQKGWLEWLRSNKLPPGIPSNPYTVYNKEWRGWGDWTGRGSVWTHQALLALLRDLRPQLPYLEERDLYAILHQGGAMPTLRRSFGGASPLKVLKDLKENDGLGLEEALQYAPAKDLVGEVIEEVSVPEELGPGGTDILADDPHLEYTDGLPNLVSGDALRTVDELAALRYGLDDEVAEYLVQNRVADLWECYINKGAGEVDKALEGKGGYYFDLIRSRFRAELEGVNNLKVPEEWSFTFEGKPAPPNMMQRRTAWTVLTKKRVGNWSGVGAGKTLSAVLASRVCNARTTLVVTNNATVKGWCNQIRTAFPDSVIHTRSAESVPGRFNYIVLNYEKFQQPYRNTLVRELVELDIDFVVFDEVQLVKQRDHKASIRRKALEALVSALGERNPDFRVLGMSATPVINNLQEARKLLEIVTGREHTDLDVKATVNNALAVHRALKTNGFRHRPPYELEIHMPPLEVVRNELLPELLDARGVLGLEQTLLPAKLEAITSYVRPGTIFYTHFVDGMVEPMRRYLEDRNFQVGLYTGTDKSGLKPFLEGKVDVLIGSRPVGTGLDGLQSVCDRIVMLSLPWTRAEYEQTVGRIRRQGSAFGSVSVIVPQIVLEYEGEEWSWDKARMAAIEYKRTLSDCAVEGRIPEAVKISESELLRQSREALERWIERVGEEGMLVIEREKLTVPLPPDVREKVMVRRGDFSAINNRWSTSNSETVHQRLKADPSEWYLYHTLYREARADWDEIPAEHIASLLRSRPDLRIGDFGCGECLLRDALPEHNIIGLDYVALDESVIACDMARTPLEEASLGAVVFSLSLMGRNWPEYLTEAYRTLQPFGLLFVAEPAKRWAEEKLEKAVEKAGFSIMGSSHRGRFRYVTAVKNQL